MTGIALPAQPSLLLQVMFVALAIAMASVFAVWTRRPGVAFGWLCLTGALSASGLLQSFDLPPRLMVLFTAGLVTVTIAAWRSDWHRRPLAFLVGLQTFRIGVEIAIHQAVVEGVAPPQLTWSGRNLDIVTGVTALALVPFVRRLPGWVLHVWNAIGLGLLVNVVGVAVLSMPVAFQVFEPDNVWVVFFPFGWLPLVLVMMAWLGHVVLFKRLLEDARIDPGTGPGAGP